MHFFHKNNSFGLRSLSQLTNMKFSNKGWSRNVIKKQNMLMAELPISIIYVSNITLK